VIYKWIGKAVVSFGLAYVRRRFGRQIRFALGFTVVAIGLGAYLASRNLQEG
jgi:hypothetical protein